MRVVCLWELVMSGYHYKVARKVVNASHKLKHSLASVSEITLRSLFYNRPVDYEELLKSLDESLSFLYVFLNNPIRFGKK